MAYPVTVQFLTEKLPGQVNKRNMNLNDDHTIASAEFVGNFFISLRVI
jgi:hypothetical protein